MFLPVQFKGILLKDYKAKKDPLVEVWAPQSIFYPVAYASYTA